jgi:hypothetical protein
MADSKGNKVWGIVRIINDFRWVLTWLLGLPWGAKVLAIMTPLFLLWLSILKSFPRPVLTFFGLSTLFLIYVFFTALFKVENLSNTSRLLQPFEPEKVLDLTLTPHGDNSAELCLEVMNNGEPTKFTAQMRVLSRSYGDGVNGRPFDGCWAPSSSLKKRWDDTRPNPQYSSVTIPSGRSRLLQISRQNPENGSNQISEADLVGLNESLRWDFEHKPNSHLPFFTLQIDIFGEGYTKYPTKIYKVGPVKSVGPLGMTEVTA